jgi:hypothetical protein
VRQERGDEVVVALVANKSDMADKRVVTQVCVRGSFALFEAAWARAPQLLRDVIDKHPHSNFAATALTTQNTF